MYQATGPEPTLGELISQDDIVGKSENGITIVDAIECSSVSEMGLRLVVKISGNHREPRRFYHYDWDGASWRPSTPDPPEICEKIVSWIDPSNSNTN